MVGRDSVVGIATRYGMDGPEIKSRWGRDFPHPSRSALGPTQPPVQWYRVSFPGVEWPGRGVDHPLPSSAKVKERVQLYLYSPSEPSLPVLWWTLPLPLVFKESIRWKAPVTVLWKLDYPRVFSDPRSSAQQPLRWRLLSSGMWCCEVS
jgi:hypothetical protein